MQNFDELKNMWQQAGSGNELPDAAAVLAKVEAVRKKMIRKNILLVIMLAFTFAFITWIGFHYDFELQSTRIGIVITLVAIVTGMLFSTKLARLLLKQNDPTLSNSEYLQQMIAFRNSLRLIQTKGITFYFILLTTGLILYMYEFASRNLTFGISVYSITLGWIAFNWFYLRKRAALKQEKEISAQIAALEGLNNNLKKD
ncbi:MAG: hypothetical protein JWO09_701 [Bacteroidetes bacterium]|nr:hypothetical protein [Bacteroidota bacterium]